MSTDVLRPGEVDLEAPTPAAEEPAAAVVADPIAEEVAAGDEPVDEEPAGDEPASGQPDQQPAAKRPHTGAVAELIALRKEKKQLAERLQQFESSPVLQRLTPEIQAAILDGRVQIAAPESTRAAEQERLKSVAETLQLYKVDGQGQTIPDLEAAKRVSQFVRSEVQAEVAPVRHMNLADKARENVDKAVAFAESNGLDVDIVKEEFLSMLSQPNGAEMLSDQKIAKQVWRVAVGRMHEEGKLTKKEAAVVAKKVPAAIITESAGRRASASAAITLSPALQRVYAEAGLKPEKAYTATKQINYNGPIDLES